jgi:hypothetical protein
VITIADGIPGQGCTEANAHGHRRGIDIARRISLVLEEIEKTYTTGNVLVVSHKTTTRIMLCSLLGIDVGRFRDRITVRDSSLSTCTQAVLAAEVGQLRFALDYAAEAALMDLQDLEHNARDGLRIASLAGTWIALVKGFGGMRDHAGVLSFAPRCQVASRRFPSPSCVASFAFAWRGMSMTIYERTVKQPAGIGIRQWPHGPGDCQEQRSIPALAAVMSKALKECRPLTLN